MDLVWELILQSVEILTLVVGILGMALSLLLIVSPERFQRLSRKLDYWVNLDEKLAVLDSELNTDRFVYRHHRTVGILLISGSLFTLGFFFSYPNIDSLADILFTEERLKSLSQIILNAAVMLGKIAGMVGVVLGGLLVFSAGTIRAMETRMGTGLTTQPFVDKLNEFHGGLGAILFSHPLIFGLAGLAASMLLAYTGASMIMR